jgi:Flp pilus assembly pilin Flp
LEGGARPIQFAPIVLFLVAGGLSPTKAGGEMDHRATPVQEQTGQTMAEYAVVLTVITLAIVTMLSLLSTSVTHLISTVVPLI